jgi:hypothetical protein
MLSIRLPLAAVKVSTDTGGLADWLGVLVASLRLQEARLTNIKVSAINFTVVRFIEYHLNTDFSPQRKGWTKAGRED